jgi:hypothetical protein
MADETTASVIPLHQVPPEKKAGTSAEKTSTDRSSAERPSIDGTSTGKTSTKKTRAKTGKTDGKTGAQRTKATRQRKKASPVDAAPPESSEHLIPLDFSSADAAGAARQVPAIQMRQPQQSERAPAAAVKSPTVVRSRMGVGSILLTAAAIALAIVGMTMNGWFARSLGSSAIAGWLFLAIGVAADMVALVMPSCAARLWQGRQRGTSLAAWAVWLMTFAFSVTAGVGFASVNIADVTTARASRLTPAVQVAQGALMDAMAARDRECKGGVGKFCREREAAVNERRQLVDTAMQSVERTADPQTEAATRIVAWLTHGALRPSGDDFAMLRLVLLALLPQIGGILLMVSRSSEA